MKKLGTVPIPEIRYQREGNRAQAARKVNIRSMISTMAILRWGEAGHIGTSVVENTLYLWLKDTERKEE
jgi:hypothetical protein